jgi:Domain of unknown function (DUF6894)
MPVYFFHLSNGQEILPDEDGIELADAQAAHSEAVAAVRELTDPERGNEGKLWSGWRMNVVDASGTGLLEIDMAPARTRTRAATTGRSKAS